MLEKIERYNENRKMNTKEQLEALWKVVNHQHTIIIEMNNDIRELKDEVIKIGDIYVQLDRLKNEKSSKINKYYMKFKEAHDRLNKNIGRL